MASRRFIRSIHVSRDKVHFQYGLLQMRARIDVQYGSWPAFWILGVGGRWPDRGECDIMEYYQHKLLFNVAWWKSGDPPWTPRWDSVKVQLDTLPAGWADELYNEWDSGEDSGDGSAEGFQQPHYFLLNQAIGGKAGGDATYVVYPTRYGVDYVRLYERAGR